MKPHARFLKALLPLLVVAVLLLGLAACNPQQQELPFDTIAKDEIGNMYREKEPKLVIITGLGMVDSFGELFSTEVRTQLRGLDFGQYFAVSVFQGVKGTNRYGVEIQRVTLKEGNVTIYAHFIERDSKTQGSAVETSPYHLVRVQKGGIQGKMKFALTVDGTGVIEAADSVP